MGRALEGLKRQNQLKSKECQEACKSLQELQNDLMRKSMHVGSLAFVIEGQVKEKSRWFSSLRDMTRKLKIMKMEHIKLSEEASLYKNCIMDINEIGTTILSRINQQADLHEDLKIKFIEGAKERKELYNKVLELNDTAPFATSVLYGYNVFIFAYGQTGTGKTFTMEGTKETRGVNFRTLEELFLIIKEWKKLYRYEISVSALEVYNEQIRDLLVSGSHQGMMAKRLEIRQVGEAMLHVPGLFEAHVNNMNKVWEVLQTGSNARAVGSTNANERSSRSHCTHCVMVKGENLLNGECTKSKLWPALPLSVTDGSIKHIDPAVKENNPEVAELLQLPKRMGRASICPTTRRMSVSSAPRGNSLIPLPCAPSLAQLAVAPPFLPLPSQPDIEEEVDEYIPGQTVCKSPKGMKSVGKKLSSILRRSLQKKVQLKSPMQQHLRRGVNVGMDRVRVSIGSRGRIRVLVGNGRRGGTKEIQQKQNQKEKGRGWNIVTVGRTAI
ncbi:hypothetical protein CRYUN_Cryun33cG0008000 [Craigia yunnanensis]